MALSMGKLCGCSLASFCSETYIHDGEIGQDLVETLLESLLSELDFAHVE
jgi:hypothetical protein